MVALKNFRSRAFKGVFLPELNNNNVDYLFQTSVNKREKQKMFQNSAFSLGRKLHEEVRLLRIEIQMKSAQTIVRFNNSNNKKLI